MPLHSKHCQKLRSNQNNVSNLRAFSQSVSRTMKAACHLGVMKSSSAADTADFIGRMNDILDALNSQSPDDKCPLRRPLSIKNSQVKKFLKDGLQFIDTWKVYKLTKSRKGDLRRVRNPPCFSGLKLTKCCTFIVRRSQIRGK